MQQARLTCMQNKEIGLPKSQPCLAYELALGGRSIRDVVTHLSAVACGPTPVALVPLRKCRPFLPPPLAPTESTPVSAVA